MKIISKFCSVIGVAAIALATATFFTGCAGTTGSGGTAAPAVVQNLITPDTLHFVAENGTYIALRKDPTTLPAFELAVSDITNAISGGTLNLNATNLVSALDSLGYGGLAKIPGANLVINDINFAALKFDGQFPDVDSLNNNTNVVAALKGVATGIQAGITDYQ